MARAFRRVGGAYVAQLEEDESRLVITLARDVLHLLDMRAGEGSAMPDDGGRDGASGTSWWEELGLSDPEASPGPETLEPPVDPALARLLPPVTEQDSADEARLRAMLEPQVVASKRAALQEAIELLRQDPLRVPEADAHRFGAALNDIRLVLSERLGIADQADAERVARLAEAKPSKNRDVDDVEHFMAMLYSFVSWLQESLMTALLKRR
ncbi:MAG: DUF2017 family protein [Galactobacter sp.]